MFFRRFYRLLYRKNIERYNEILELIVTVEKLVKNESESVLSKELAELESNWSEDDLDLDDEMMQELYEMDMYQIELKKQSYERWQNTLWKSLFLTIYMDFESDLDKICTSVKNMKKLKLPPSALKDKGINRSKYYLESVADFELNISAEKWDELLVLNKIRNLIAHNGSSIKSADNKIKKYISKSELLDTDKHEHIIISSEYLKESMDTCQKVYLSICEILDSYAIQNLPPNIFENSLNL